MPMLFDPNAQKMLARLADAYLPIRSPSSGQIIYDVGAYLESLLSAFDQDQPRIYAGGPFSGRNARPNSPAPPNDFQASLPLSRYQRLAWKLRINGPDGLTDEPFVVLSDEVKRNYVGLTDIILGGLNSAERLANDRFPRPTDADDLLRAAGPDFMAVFPDLVAEAAFSAPEYLGNRGTWPEIFYPGDSLPTGYDAAAISQPGPGAEPYPIHELAEILLWFSTIVQHGRKFK